MSKVDKKSNLKMFEIDTGHICQNCKYHTNHPSRCRLRHTFVPRKSFCEYFKGGLK